jgi:hypothetical protein
VAGLFLSGLVVAMSALLSVYFEREPTRVVPAAATGLSAGATTLPPPPVAIAAPEEHTAASGPTVISTDDLPSVAVMPHAVRSPPRTGAPGTSNAAGNTPTAAAARSARSVDKSEVF